MAQVTFDQAYWESQYMALLYQDSVPNGRFNWEGPLGSPVTVTYRFAETYPAYSGFLQDPENLFAPIADYFRPLYTGVMDELSRLTNLTFVEDLTLPEGEVDVMILGGKGFYGTGYWPLNGQVPQTGDLLMPAVDDGLNYDPAQNGGFDRYRDLLLHELGHAIGLSHPIDYGFGNGTHQSDYSIIMDPALVTQTYTVMAYAGPLIDPFNTVATYMPLDILALQHLYGINTTATSGDDIYRLEWDRFGVRTLWDYGGTDTIDLSAMQADGSLIDLRIGGISAFGIRHDRSYYDPLRKNTANMIIGPDTIVERAIGSDFADTIIGHDRGVALLGGGGDDELRGGGGDDHLSGGAGNDLLAPGAGRDIIDGGAGQDTIRLDGRAGGFTALVANGLVFLTGREGSYQVSGVEAFRFTDGTLAQDQLAAATIAFDPARYLASHADLAASFGTDMQQAAQHFAAFGFAEGRSVDQFDAWHYLASNPDLIVALRGQSSDAIGHYLSYGAREGRDTDGFDAPAYLANNTDLLRHFGPDEAAAARHFVDFGFAEGRTAAFDSLAYIASHADLIAAYGTDRTAATRHYVDHGFAEGRATDDFDALQYAASYDDLAVAFGTDSAAATSHYLAHGAAEGRSADMFDGLGYIASHADLIVALGSNDDAAATHYLTAGRIEGRAPGAFDALAYAAANPDLAQAFGTDADRLTAHYIDHGFYEGRQVTPDSAFALF